MASNGAAASNFTDREIVELHQPCVHQTVGLIIGHNTYAKTPGAQGRGGPENETCLPGSQEPPDEHNPYHGNLLRKPGPNIPQPEW